MSRSVEDVRGGSGDGVDAAAVDWDALPERVRGRLVDVAAHALGDLPKSDLPARLRAVARFAPAKRARVAAAPLLAALRDDTAFRAAVVAWAHENRPRALDTDQPDAVAAAAASVLHGGAETAQRLRAVARQTTEDSLRGERDAALARIERLEAELERTRVELAAEQEATRAAKAEREAELSRLRERLRARGTELREQRDALRAARAELAGAGAETAGERAELVARERRERERADAERRRADRAEADADAARRAAREARQADEVRLALLLDAVEGGAAGLRAELGVAGTSGPRPADTVAGGGDGVTSGLASVSDLDRMLTVPSVHLIVDGYNITKTGYPELSLAEQRERLARQLSALAARTSAEVTAVFDGARVVAVPITATRGVRVLFSDPGVQADDLIRSLVAAEPAGRPLVVATSDREVVESVRARGAHTTAARVLLDLMERI